MSVQPSLDLLDKIFLRARENAVKMIGEDVLDGAEVFLLWNCPAGNWCIELFLRHCIAEKFNIWLEKKTPHARIARIGDFCHEFARWCPPIDRGMVPSQLNAQLAANPQSPESVVWLGPLVSFEDISKVHFPRSLFAKPKAAELLLLGFTSTQLQVIDTAAHTKAMATAFGKCMNLNDKLKALQEKVKERMKAGSLGNAEVASLLASMKSTMKERARINKEANETGRILVPVLPFSAESLEELEMKVDLFFPKT